MMDILKGKTKMWKFFQILSFTLFTILLLNTSNIFAAGSGEIRGKVVDAVSGEFLPFANIMLEGTSIGTATDSKGFYKILKVPSGSYNMIAKFIGYTDDTLAVTVVADKILEQNVELRYGAVEMGEVTITAQAEGQVNAINRQLNANSVMNVVSSDRLQELPDANVAESVGRIPGVSLEREAGEASKVVIRGLEPKLNAVTVNGVRIPSTSSGTGASADRHAVSKDEGDRAVDLSMMSGDLLEAIEVYKAPTPDMDAEAVGGVVNLKVKKAPDEMSILVRANGGFNQLNDDFSNYKFVGQYGQRFFDKKFGLILGGSTEKINRGSERYEAEYNTDGVRDSVTGIVPVQGLNMRMRDTEEIRKRWGAYLTLDYKYNDGVIWMTNFYTKSSRNPFSITKRYDPNAGDSQIRYDVRYQEIDLAGYSNTLNGEHQLFGMDIDWVLSRYVTKTTNSYDMEMKYTGAARWDYSILDPKDIDTYVPAANDSLKDLYLRNSFFRPDTTEQTDYATELNFQVPFVLAKSISGFLKFGGKYYRSERERIAISRGIADYYQGGDIVANAQALHPGELTINSSGRIEAANFITSGTDSRKILDGKYELFPIFDKDKLKDWHDSQNSTYFGERFPLSDEYDLKETVGAGYVMAKLNVGQAWTVIPGVRYEQADNTYNAVYTTIGGKYGANGITKDTTSTVNYDNWFPHLHIKYKPLDWFDIRVAALKTIARPNYYWVLPWTRINTENARIDRGNPDLKPGLSWNYELSSSFYSSHIGLFTVGGFYKDMTDIFFKRTSYVHDPQEIEDLQIPGGQGGYRMRSYFNYEVDIVYGFEIDLQTQLFLVPGMPDFLKGIVLNLNYSRIYSEAHYPHSSRTDSTDYSTWPTTTITTYNETTREASLVGQADQIFNISLGYDVGGFSARLSLLYQGGSLDEVGTIVEEDKWDDDFWRWDASLKYKLDNGLSFFFNLAHISGQPDRTFFGVSDRQTERSYYGMTGDIGIQFIY